MKTINEISIHHKINAKTTPQFINDVLTGKINDEAPAYYFQLFEYGNETHIHSGTFRILNYLNQALMERKDKTKY